MLPILKQYKDLFTSLILNNFAGKGETPSIKESKSTIDLKFLDENTDIVSAFLKKSDLESLLDVDNILKDLADDKTKLKNVLSEQDNSVSYKSISNSLLKSKVMRLKEHILSKRNAVKESKIKRNKDLGSIDYIQFNRVLKEGVKGADVEELQKFLCLETGTYKMKDLKEKGTFGVKTYGMLYRYLRSKKVKGRIKGAGKEAFDLIIADIKEHKEGVKTQEQKIKKPVRKTKEIIAKRNHINYPSLIKEVSHSSYEEILDTISLIDAVKKYQKDNRYKIDENFNPLKPTPTNRTYKYVFNKHLEGYEADGFLGNWEIDQIHDFLKSVERTQIKMVNVGYKEKLALLVDYDANGKLDNEVHFYTKEKELFDVIKDETQFENLLMNLGYKSIDQFNKEFRNNYISARRSFKNRLGVVLSTDYIIDPVKMINNPNEVKGVIDNVSKMKEEINIVAEEEMKKNPRLQKLIVQNPEVKERIKLELASIVGSMKLEAVGAVVGESTGIGASFDIKKATRNIIHSMQIGIINGVPGFGLSRNIYKTEKEGFRADGGVINFIPYIGISSKVYEGKISKTEKLFTDKIGAGVSVKMGGAISIKHGFVGLEFGKVDENTHEGIAQLKEKMSEGLEDVFNYLKTGTKFEDTRFKNTKENKRSYERMAYLYKAAGSTEQAKIMLIEGALNNYERHLHENAKGLKFSGVGVGLAIFGTFMLPIVMVNADVNRAKWGENGEKDKKKNKNNFFRPIETFDSGLRNKLDKVEGAFSWKTRYNKGAKDLMTPNNSLAVKWRGIEKLSRNVKALRESNLAEIIKDVNTSSKLSKKDKKWYVVSTISQYMKKSNDYNNGDLTDMNNKVKRKKLIDKDIKRRHSFNTLLGFNATEEATEYYKKLSAAKKVGKQTIMSVGFDASASANVEGKDPIVKGMEILYSNLKVITVDGKPLLVPLKSQFKKNQFIKKISDRKDLLPEVKAQISRGVKNGDIELYFYKDPDGFDDRVIPAIINPEAVSTFLPTYSRFRLIGGVAPEKVNEDRKKAPTGQHENDAIEEGDGQIETPGGNIDPVDTGDTTVTDLTPGFNPTNP